tara:strand:- start:1818 stop:3227 length:1410 start_codon:yes stop_codon:yes gene_type:complete
MDSDRIEKRLRRLDAAVARTERRIATLAAVRDRHDNTVTGAVVRAEVSRELFIAAAQVAFREPYRALKAWERHEWRLANLTLQPTSEEDIATGAHAAVANSTRLAGLTLRGKTLFGRDDPERLAAREALRGMAGERANWLVAVRRARTYGLALEQVSKQIGSLKNRLRGIGIRRDELLERLHARDPVEPTVVKERHEDERSRFRPALDVPASVEQGLAYVALKSRMDRLDKATQRYHERRAFFAEAVPLDQQPGNAHLRFLDRRIAATHLRRSELTVAIAKAEQRLPEGISFSEDELADMRELHRAYGAFVEEQLEASRYPKEMTIGEREQLAAMARRAERLERGMKRYRERLRTLNDPEFQLPEPDKDRSGYLINDAEMRAGQVRMLQSRLARAEVRRRILREAVVTQTLPNRSLPSSVRLEVTRKRDDRTPDETAEAREKRAQKERDRLARLYQQARSRADSLRLER